MEEFALASHAPGAARRSTAGCSTTEIAPVGGVAARRGTPRRDTSLEKLAVARSRCADGGRLTAALASQISDGAAALLVASGRGGTAARAHRRWPGCTR